MSITEVVDFIPMVTKILTFIVIVLTIVIIVGIWVVRDLIRKNRLHRIQIAIYELNEFPEKITYYDVYQKYLGIKNFEKIEKYTEFSNLSKEILIKNISDQKSFENIDRFFAGWNIFEKNQFMMEVHAYVSDRTKDDVISLAKKYCENTVKDIHDHTNAKRFNQEINKDYYTEGYDLPGELKDAVDGILTLRAQQNNHHDK